MATFLLEVGTEELPAAFVASAIAQWQTQIPQSLEENRLTPERIDVYGTPRRIAVLVTGLPEQQPDQAEEIKGPPSKAAFKDGQPTKAAEGFARKQGVEIADFELRETDKGEFIFVQKTTLGQPAKDVLPELIPQWIFGLEGKRFMRWRDGDLRFSRPIRWLVSLYNDEVLPLELENGGGKISCDRISQGHRVLHPEPISIPHAQDYIASLEAAFVQVDQDQRQTKIAEQIEAVAKKLGGKADIRDSLLQEVTHLVEWPTAVGGGFESEFLELPTEVITTEMISHQRYFPVVKSSQLLPHFITISNGDPAKSEIISAGNERVIRARLSDGQFFYKADQGVKLDEYLPKLETVTFQEDLGSVRLKTDRIEQNAQRIVDQLQLDKNAQAIVKRAAQLCKADLVTQMVGEFPELQGLMGQKYATASGEPEAVATAIGEHYLPKGADDDLPQSLPGQVVAIADRLDTLVSIFCLGLIPTGSSDPFALRRSANAIINITWDAQLPLNLHQLLFDTAATCAETVEKSMPAAELQQKLQEFFLVRIRSLLQDELKIDYDLVNAVLGTDDPEYTQRALVDVLDVCDRAKFLQQIRDDKTLGGIYETVNRAARLASKGNLEFNVLDATTVVDAKRFEQDSESAFYAALNKLLPEVQAAQEQRDYQRLVKGLAESAPKVSAFFNGPDSVLVMAEDAALKQNRLNLLGVLRNQARVLADFGEIVKG
ncbi:Glycine--tRNA ligase beta subunit [Acaryochloris thomasi RCC1774]|uniref:Glycine--tRNA ligase beta subunit n=1 Tax=Acaryochloris thomasi RCC1774 TaxID=1764569 RepID=A0A2W1JL27_9CYAN|nr:glycine--tRNA ligase subunit beta [Acaryochloris thomasi]PZD74090.1 Glycine--tRNA ligase beta subunit [Acaryochloris thomasi RCC1774]